MQTENINSSPINCQTKTNKINGKQGRKFNTHLIFPEQYTALVLISL